MNKKILSGILCGALIVASASTFVSCKDYDDDISGVQKQVDANKDAADEQYKTLTALVEANMNKVQGQIETINGKIDDVDEAYKAADAELKAAIEAEKAALEALTSTAGTADASAQEVAIKLAAVATELREKAEANAADIAAVKTNLETAKSELQASIDANKASVDESIKTINETIAALKAASSTGAAQEDIDALEKKLTDEITTLTAKDVELEKAISAAQADIAQAQSDIKDLNARLTSVETYTQELQGTTIPALQKAVEDLKTDLAKMSSLGTSDAAVATVSKAVDALAARVSANEEAIAKIKERVAGIEAAVTGLKNDFAAYQLLVSADFAQVWASIDSLKARVAATEGRLDVLEPALEAEADARKAVNGKVDTEIADRQAACAELNGRVDSLNTALATQLSALNLRLNTEITNRRNADTKLNDSIDVVAANLDKAVNNLTHEIEELKGDLQELGKFVNNINSRLIALNDNFNNLKKDLSHLITSIVYQGDGAQGSYTTTPTTYGNQPVIWYKKLTSDFAAWPFDSIDGSIKETAAGKTVSFYHSGHIYATLNPSTVDLTGIELYLENSMGELNKYVKLSNVTLAEDVVLTKAKNAGFYCMRVLPTADFDSAAFVDDVDLYAIAAIDKLTDGSSRKVTSSYGINTEFETWTKSAPSVVAPEWKATYSDGSAVADNNVGGFGSDFEFRGETLNSNPGGFIQLNCDTTKIYKWYVEFFKDDNYSQNAKYDPTKIFTHYQDRVQYGFQGKQNVALADFSLLNTLIYVKVTAVGYDYTKKEMCHTISFSRPLFAGIKVTDTFYPEWHNYCTATFTQKFFDAFRADSAAYNRFAALNGENITVDPIIDGFEGLIFDVKNPVLASRAVAFTYDPYKIAYNGEVGNAMLNNEVKFTVTDDYGHIVMYDTLVAKIGTPDHLDSFIGLADNRIPAAFNYFKKAGQENTINIWCTNFVPYTAGSGKADYNFSGAFNNIITTSDVPDATVAGTLDGYTLSNDSKYAFCSDDANKADIEISAYNEGNPYSVKLNDVKNITVFGDVVNEDVYTHNAGRPVPSTDNLDFGAFKQYKVYQCVDYYDMAKAGKNVFYGAKHDNFKIAFVDPINYGFSEKNNLELPISYETLPANCYAILTNANYNDEFFWYDHSKTKGDIADLNKFYLSDRRICNIEMEIDPEFTTANKGLIQNFNDYYTAGSFSFSFDYTSTSINDEAYIPAYLYVTDVWGVKSKVAFKIHLTKHQL